MRQTIENRQDNLDEAEKVGKGTQHIDSAVTGAEIGSLYLEAKKAALKGAIVEVGSWKGRSAVVLGLACKATGKGKVYAIDPHKNSISHRRHNIESTLEVLKENLAKARVGKYVEIILKTSAEANRSWPKDRKVSLLWIDADHRFLAAKKDLILWCRYVIPGGIVVLHDVINYHGLRRLMLRHILRSRQLVCFSLVGEMAFLKKKKKMKITKLFSKDHFNIVSLLRNMVYLLSLSLFFRFHTPRSCE